MTELARGGPEDAAAVAALAAAELPGSWSLEAFAGELRVPGARLWTAKEAGRLLGYLAGRRLLEVFEVFSLTVTAPARRRGLGRALLARALADETGVEKVFLEVREGSRAARAFYEACGFVAVGRRRRYYADGEDAILMTRSL